MGMTTTVEIVPSILLVNGADASSPDQMGTTALVYLAESWKD